MARCKTGIGIDVLTAARQRISAAFDTVDRAYVSFSGGKDSTVLLHLVADEALQRGRKFGLLFIDLEAQYRLTAEFVEMMFREYRDVIDPFWIALPIRLRNAVSMYEPRWMCWDDDRYADWVRKKPRSAIGDATAFTFFRVGMEFEEFVSDFGTWYADGKLTACFVGIRADESLNRFRSIAKRKSVLNGWQWTTYMSGTTYNCYPLYDWRDADIWTYFGKSGKPYNHLYDRMNQAGLSIHQQRICQPYGDDQRKGLWLYHIIEPETWGRVVARVNGANSGALYARESGNILGNLKITRPEGHTWKSFAMLILASLPEKTRVHFEDKIAVFIKWYQERGYPNGIPDSADPKEEAARRQPSWRRICKALLRNDYWCKGLSFSQHKSESYSRYRKVMQTRRKKWGII